MARVGLQTYGDRQQLVSLTYTHTNEDDAGEGWER